jgi:hypothetical protein
MEHRWGRRVRVDIDVQILADPASAGWGRVRDISISGGFIETALKIPVLSTLELTVPAAGRTAARILSAVVVRSDVDGVGVEWLDGESDVICALIEEAAAWNAPRPIAGEIRL